MNREERWTQLGLVERPLFCLGMSAVAWGQALDAAMAGRIAEAEAYRAQAEDRTREAQRLIAAWSGYQYRRG